METIKKNLNYIGLLLVFGALAAMKIWPALRLFPLLAFILGTVALVVYIVLHLPALKQGMTRKPFIYSSNLLLLIVLVMGILVLVNYFLARHHYRIDFTESKLHSLSDQSVTVLKNLRNEVHVKCFFRESNFNRAAMENLMQIYAYHSGKLKYEFIDPDKNPGLVKRYEIAEDGTTILESGDKESRITTTGEEDITNAVIQVTRERKKIIYFLEGHGEKSVEISDDFGYSVVKGELEKQGYEVKTLSLALAGNFPADATAVVIPGPEKDLLPQELDTIRQSLKHGGRFLIMVDPQTAPDLPPFLRDFGIALSDDIVIDTVSRLLGGDYFMPVVNEYDDHAITKNFRYATFFPYARSVDVTEDKPQGVTLQILARSSDNSWSERQLDQREVTYDKEKDKLGPIPLAVVGTIDPEEGTESQASPTPDSESEAKQPADTPEEGQEPGEGPAPAANSSPAQGRLAVFGDSDFAANSYYHLSGNGNMFLNTLNWLTEEEDLISIQAKTSNPRVIQMSPSQGRLLFFVVVLLLPLAVLVIGISIWLRRRSL